MNYVANSLTRLRVLVLTALIVALPGCATHEVKSASVEAKFTIPGILETKAQIQIEKKPSPKFMPSADDMRDMAYAVANDSRIELTASNARIPDQTTLATISVKNGVGNTIAARTFVASVVSGRGTFNNSSEVEEWLNGIAIPDDAIMSIAAPDIEIYPPQQGTYTATNKLVISNQIMASATAMGRIPPRNDPRPPTHPQ